MRIDNSETRARFTSRRFNAGLIRKAGRIRRDRAATAAICVVLSSDVDGKCGTRHRDFIITVADVHILTFYQLVNAAMFSILLVYAASSVSAQPIDESTCRVASSTALRVPEVTADWTILAPSSRYQTSFMASTNNSLIRVMATPTVETPLAAIEYRLPAPSAFALSRNAWAYDIEYGVVQGATNTSSSRLGLGAWHTIGFDWGESGDAPNLTSIRYSTGGNDPGSVPRPYTTLMRFTDDGDCAALDDVSQCAFIEWQNKTTPDTRGELRQMNYRFILDEARMYPARVQSNFVAAEHEARFAKAQISAPTDAVRRPPTRLVLVMSATGVLIFHMKISVVELDCPPSSSTTTQASIGTTRQSTITSLSQSTNRDTATASLVESRELTTSTQRSADSLSDATTDSAPVTPPPTAPSSLVSAEQRKPVESISHRINAANRDAEIASIVGYTISIVVVVFLCAFSVIRVRKSESWQKWYNANISRPAAPVATASQIYGPITFATDPPIVVYEQMPPTSIYATVPPMSEPKIYDSPTSPLVN